MIYLTLFLEFFKIGLFTFGGGYAMIPLVAETVVGHGWMSESAFYSFLGVCESTPGPIAINMATYVGSTQGGLLGSIVATLGVITPSFIIILVIASLLKNLTNNRFFKAFIKGVNPVVVALILSTAVILLAKAIGYISISEFVFDLCSLVIFAVLCALYFLYKLIFKKKMPTLIIIALSAGLGIAICSLFEALAFI
ncbi:MAG: chromate transporter [Clostridia bacterium]|nr:chromate transporter [Clostridia bacterium]